MDTYSSRPIISKDGPDANGFRAEVKVVTGVGIVDDIEMSDKGKAAKVVFKVENTKYKSYGWVPVDQKIYKMVEDAKESREPIQFRIETRRRDDVDRKRPINELTEDRDAKSLVVKSLSATKKLDDEKWIVSPHAKTNMAEDPVNGAPSANSYTIEELKSFDAPASAGGASVYYGFEGSPYVLHREDSKVNYGSNAIGVPIEVYRRFTDYLKEQEIEVSEVVKMEAVKTIISAASGIQVAVYDGELDGPDFSVKSYQRSIDLAFDSMEMFYPLDKETISNKEKLQEWQDQTVAKMSKMLKWSLNMLNSFNAK